MRGIFASALYSTQLKAAGLSLIPKEEEVIGFVWKLKLTGLTKSGYISFLDSDCASGFVPPIKSIDMTRGSNAP